MSFTHYLKKRKANEKVSAKSLIIKLQLFHPAFEKLDPVTLSRWINGRTTPSLEKQLLLVSYFGSDLLSYINSINQPEVSGSTSQIYDNIFEDIESSYHSIMLSNELSSTTLTPEIEKVTWSELTELVPNFYESTTCYQRVLSNKSITEKEDIVLCSIKSENKVVSHLSISTNLKYLSNLFGSDINFDIKENGVAFNIGYLHTRIQYELLLGILFNYVCDNFKHLKEIYVIVRGTKFLNFVEHFGGVVISSSKENRNIGNIFLLKLDFMKTISNAFYLSLIKNANESYKEIIESMD